jgi:hypothetical protein
MQSSDNLVDIDGNHRTEMIDYANIDSNTK